MIYSYYLKDKPAGHRDRSSETKQSIEMEGGNLGVVSLEVREVEVVGKRLLGSRKPHRLEKRLSRSITRCFTIITTRLPSVLKLDYQLQLGSTLLLADAYDRQGLHCRDRVPYRVSVGGVHLLLGHPELELLPHALAVQLTAFCQGKVGQAVKGHVFKIVNLIKVILF